MIEIVRRTSMPEQNVNSKQFDKLMCCSHRCFIFNRWKFHKETQDKTSHLNTNMFVTKKILRLENSYTIYHYVIHKMKHQVVTHRHRLEVRNSKTMCNNSIVRREGPGWIKGLGNLIVLIMTTSYTIF